MIKLKKKINIIEHKLILILSLYLALISCNQDTFEKSNESNNGSKIVTRVSSSTLLKSELNDIDKAKALADAAEILLNADGFSHANEYSKLALELDASNLKANAIKAFTDLMEALKGILIRIQPYFEKTESGKILYKKTLFDYQDLAKYSEIYAYLLKGNPEFSTETEIQNYLDQLAIKLNQLRIFAKNNKDSNLTIKAHSLLFRKELVDRYVEACEIKQDQKTGDFEIKCPDNRIKSEIQLNFADFEVIQQFATAKIIDLAIFTSYDLSGYSDVFTDKNSILTTEPQQIYAQLIKNEKFGQLRKSNLLKITQTLGLDLLKGLEWASSNSSILCQSGTDSPQNRLGMLFNTGICISPYLVTALQELTINTLSNQPTIQKYNLDNSEYEAHVNYGKLISEPIEDIRSLGLKFDACGNIISVEDQGFGSLYPNQDANIVLNLMNKFCEK